MQDSVGVIFQGASKIHSLINSYWKVPQQVSGPTSCSKQCRLRRSNQVAPGFILVGLGNLQRQRLHNLPEQPVAVLDGPCGWSFSKAGPKSLTMLHKSLVP